MDGRREGERRGLFNHFSVSFFFVVLLLQMCTRIYRWKNRLSVLFPFNEASEGSRITFPRGIFPFYKHFLYTLCVDAVSFASSSTTTPSRIICKKDLCYSLDDILQFSVCARATHTPIKPAKK